MFPQIKNKNNTKILTRNNLEKQQMKFKNSLDTQNRNIYEREAMNLNNTLKLKRNTNQTIDNLQENESPSPKQ